MELGERIRVSRELVTKFRGDEGRTQFAKAVGVTYETVRQWESGKIHQLRPHRYQKICSLTGVRRAWLETGEGPMLQDANGPSLAQVLRDAKKLTREEALSLISDLVEHVRQADDE